MHPQTRRLREIVLFASLGSIGLEVSFQAGSTLAGAQHTDESQLWLLGLQASEAEQRAAALRSLSCPDALAARLRRPYLDLLGDPDAKVRSEAVEHLGLCLLSIPDEEAIVALFRRVSDPVSEVRDRALGLLDVIGSHWESREADDTVPTPLGPPSGDRPPHPLRAVAGRVQDSVRLLAGLVAEDALAIEARLAAAALLGWVGGGRSDTVAALAAALRSPQPRLRSTAAYSLGRLEPPPLGALAELLQALEDPDRPTRSGAAKALARLGGAAAPELVQRLAFDTMVRVEAQSVLEQMGNSAVPALLDALRDERWTIREAAVLMLGRIRAEARNAQRVVKGLIARLGDPRPEVRTAAADALGQLGTAAQKAAAPLRSCLGDPDVRVRAAAERALRQIETQPPRLPG
jgi:HEAT repeat protein